MMDDLIRSIRIKQKNRIHTGSKICQTRFCKARGKNRVLYSLIINGISKY